MRILAIGDPHGNVKKLKTIPKKGVDLILLTGDLGKAELARKQAFGNMERRKKGLKEIELAMKEEKAIHMEIHDSTLGALRYLSQFASVYTIQGNVGIATLAEVRAQRKKSGINLPATRHVIDRMPNVSMVKNKLRILNGLRIGFLEYYSDISWVKNFKPSDYQKRMKRAREETEKARGVLKRFGKLDILVCHQPPYGILDKVNFPGVPKNWLGKHAGGKAILDYVKKYQPRYVFCGHIHEGKGMKKIGRTEVYNLGVCGYKILEL
jgi:Icc-related predicted phosphoesterase